MSYIRTDTNRNPVGTANILSDSIIVHNYQAVDTIVTSSTQTLNSLTQSNLNVSSTIYNDHSTTSGLKAKNVFINTLNINGSGNSMTAGNINGNNLSLINLDNQDGNISNVSQLNIRNLNVSSYLYANKFVSESINIEDGNGIFNKNINVNGALNANILNNNHLHITQLENSENITFAEGNVTNNLNAPDIYMEDVSIVNNQITIQKDVNMEQNTLITRLDASDLYIQEKRNSSTISQNNVNNTSLALIGPSSVTFSGSADINENTSGNNKIVRRNADIINAVFESNLNVNALLGTVNGISLLNSNIVNVVDTLYIENEYNHTTNDIDTNGNLIVTTRNFIVPTAVVNNEANVARRIFNSDTVSANVVEASTLFINESARAGNINAGAITAGSYNALRRITTTGNVESNVLISNRLRGTGEFIFNSEVVDINTLQTVDLNLNNTTISFISSNSEGGNIDLSNLNSYITSNVITGYSTANIIAGNVVQDIVVGNILANVKVGEVITGNIYLGNILTEIIVSNTTANLIVGNLSTFITVGNSVSNVVVGNISSNVFIGNLEVIGIVGNVSSNIISGNISSNVIAGYQESNIIVGNIESQVLVGQTTTQVIDGYTIENIITGNTTANVIVGTYQEEVFIGNTVANLVVGNVTANIISGYELANLIIGNVFANIVVGNVMANIVVGNVLGNIVIGNIEQSVIVGNITGNGIVGNVYANIIVGNVESSNVIIGNTVVPNVVIGNITTENVVIGNIITSGVVGNTITSGVIGNIVGAGNANLNISNLTLSSVAIDSISIPNIWNDLTSGNLSGNIVTNKNVGNVILTFGTSDSSNIAASSFLPAYNNTQPLTTIAWSPELSLFVAGAQNGNNNRFLTSPDGINWTNRTSTANSNWFGSCWSPELSLFAMVGGGCCATSPDGINWTARTIPSGEWADICWSKELSLFVAVAWSSASTNLAVMTSSDGITWTGRTTPNNFQWQSVTWSPQLSLFVAVAGGAVNGNGTNTNVMTSPNGITWTLRTTNLQRRWYGVAWSPTLSMFVAVARTGGTSSIMSSTNGINWTSRTSPNMTFNNIIWVSEHSMFIVSTSGASSIAIFSRDGINWNTINNGTGDIGDYYDLAWAPSLGRLCLVNNNATNKVAYATTTVGTSITSGNIIETNYFLGNIISSNVLIGNIFTENVIVGNITANVVVGNILTENVIVGNIITTGIIGNITSNVMTNVYNPSNISYNSSFTTYTSITTTQNWNDFIEGSNILVAIGEIATGNSSSLVATSTDAKTWTTRTTPSNNRWSGIAWSPSLNLFVACAEFTARTTNIMTSPDGITWTARTTPVSDVWYVIKWSPELNIFVAMSRTRAIVSSNGTTWTSYTISTPSIPFVIEWSSTLGIFITVCLANSTILTSSNGTTWTTTNVSNVSIAFPRSIIWSTKLQIFCLVCNNNLIFTSPDGINWTFQATLRTVVTTTNTTMTKITWSSKHNLFFLQSNFDLETNKYYMTSPDGIEWTERTTPILNNLRFNNNINYVNFLDSVISIAKNFTSNVINTLYLEDNLTKFNYPTCTASNWRSVCWSSELLQFVAVATTGTTSSIMTSTNGTTWTNRTSPNTNNYEGICWSPKLGLYCAVATSGTGNRVSTSPDGIIWIARTTPANNSWNFICWSEEVSLFVAVSSTGTATGRVMTSPDGITWTLRNAHSGGNWTSVCWAKERSIFIAISSNGLYMTSPDGITWSGGSLPPSLAWESITWSPELSIFVAVAYTASTNNIATSLDGINWTLRTSPISVQWGSVIWASDIKRFFACTDPPSPSNNMITSTDGINWTRIPLSYGKFVRMCWAPEIGELCAVSNLLGVVLIHTNSVFSDGRNFTLDNISTITNINAYEYSGNLIVGVGNSLLSGIVTNTNGNKTTWESQSNKNKKNTDHTWNGIAWSPTLNIYCAIGNKSATTNGYNTIMTSPDGINWTPITVSFTATDWNTIIWAPTLNKFVAVGTSAIMSSSDSINWTYITGGISRVWVSVAWAPSLNLLCAVAPNTQINSIVTSPDGITWTLRTTSFSAGWESIAWSPSLSLFCVLPASSPVNNYVLTSPDGINWTKRDFYGYTQNISWIQIKWIPEVSKFYALSSLMIFISSDGMNWNAINLDGLVSIKSIDWSPILGKLYGVGNSGADNTIRIITNTNSMLSGNVYLPNNISGNVFSYSYNSPSSNINFRSITYSNNFKLFCAVASSGTTSSIMTSPNGTTWTTRTAPNTNNLTSICYSNELVLFVAVSSNGSGNRVTTSSNGQDSWTARTSAANNSWSSVCWSPSLSLFVAVATNVSPVNAAQLVMTSPNGITWTIRDSYNGGSWSSICWSQKLSLFVAVSSVGGHVMTSSNGTTWTRYAAASSNAWTSVIWCRELSLFVAVANSGTGNRVMTSPDGQTWTSRTSAADYAWSSITWTNDLQRFYVVSSDTNNFMMTSTDAITWSLIPITTNTYSSICYAPEIGQICAVSSLTSASNKVLTFSLPIFADYRNFTTISSTSSGSISSVAWSPSLNTFTGIGDIGTSFTTNLIQDSYANISGNSLITTTTFDYLNNDWRSVVYSPTLNLFVAVASSGYKNRIMTSSDGITWTPRTSPADNNWEKVIWVPELSLFVAVSSSGNNNRIMTSPNGITWTLRTTSNNNWKSIAWAPTIPLLCAVGTLLYTKPATLYNTINNKIVSIANDMTPLANETIISSFGTYNTVTGTGPKYYTSGGYKNKPYIHFNSINTTKPQDTLNISSLALNMLTNGGFTLVTKVYISGGIGARYPIWQSNNANTGFGFNFISLYYYPINSSAGLENPGYFEFEIYNGGSTSTTGTRIVRVITSTIYKLNNWYTITVTVASASGSAAEIYIDGSLAATANISAALTNRTNTINFLGQDTILQTHRFHGLYDSVFVYDRKLNNTELQSIYNYIEGTSGDNNSVMTSPDGVTWTGRSTNYDSNNITSIAWSPKLSMFVAVGNNHLGNRIIRSTNGTSWTPCNVNYDYQNWKTVVWVEDLGMFYATTTDNSYDNAILTSYDGIEWLLTYPPTDAQYSWKNFVWAKSLNRLFCFGKNVNGTGALLSHTNQIGYTTSSNVTTTVPQYGNITVPQYGNVSTPVYGNVLVPQYGNVNTPVYANIITSIYGNVIIPTYSSSNSAIYGNIYFPSTLNTSNISISSNIISSNFNLTLPLYGNILTPTLGNISIPIIGNITTPQYGNIITAIYGNILIPEYGVIIEPIYANVLVPVYGNIIIPLFGNVITPVYGQAYLPVYGNVEIPIYGNVLVPEYGFVQLPIYEEVTTPIFGNVIIPIFELQDFPIYETQTIPVYTAVPTPIFSTIVEDVFETVFTPIYNTSNVPIYQTVITPIYKELITPIYGTIYLPQYQENLTPIYENRVTPIYEEVLTPIYQEVIIPQTTYVYTPVYQDIIEPVYEDVLQPVFGKALLPVYTQIQIPIYSEVLVYVDPTAKTSSTNDLFTGSATVTNLLSFANGTINNLFSNDGLYAPNLTLAANPSILNVGNTDCGNITIDNLIINPNFNARNSIITDRGLTSFRNTQFSNEFVVGNLSVNRSYISFRNNQDFKPANISVGQSLFATSVTSQTSNVTIQNISTLNGISMIHIKDEVSESNIRDNIINTTYLTSNNNVSAIDINISESATTQNINVSNETLTSGNIYGKNFNNNSNLTAQNIIATDNMFISSNVSGTFTMPRTDAGNLSIKDTVRSNHIKSSSLQDILDLHTGNISSSKLYTSIDALRSVLYKDNADNLYLGDHVAGNIYIGGPQNITQTIYIGSALDTIYIGGDLSNILSSDVSVKDAAIVINNNGTSYNNAGVQFEENSVIVGSLLLNSSGQFVFSDATGNVYSLTHIADGNFENMSVTNDVLSTSHIHSGNVLVQNSFTATLLSTQTYQNSSNINSSNVNTTNMITNSLLTTTMTSTNMNVLNNSTINGNVTISNTLQSNTFDAVSLVSSNISNSSNINGTELSFTTLNGTNAYITNNSHIENVNTNQIILNNGNLNTTNSIITKNILLDNANITTDDIHYDFKINGITHYGIESRLDTNKFGIMNITTGNTNPEPSLSLVRKNHYVWNMGYDNNSNDFVIYDGNVGVRLTASNSQSWSSVSDERYKKHVETIDEVEAMNKVMNGRGVYYNYLSDKEDAQRKVGFIAQEMAEILPEVVDIPENPEEAYSVRYQEVYPLLLQALKGAAKELKELKEKVKSKKM